MDAGAIVLMVAYATIMLFTCASVLGNIFLFRYIATSCRQDACHRKDVESRLTRLEARLEARLEGRPTP